MPSCTPDRRCNVFTTSGDDSSENSVLMSCCDNDRLPICVPVTGEFRSAVTTTSLTRAFSFNIKRWERLACRLTVSFLSSKPM